MRISSALQGVAMVIALGVAGRALAFDVKSIKDDTPPAEAFKLGFDAYKQGNKTAAAEALGYAADKGITGAQWKLGRMYAEGDGVARDEYRAFTLFSEVVSHAEDEENNDESAPYVSNAYVRLGKYYRDGIADGKVKADPIRARQIFAYAASYFGDSEAQLNLARMYYKGEGGERDSLQAARWAKLSADKGNIGAQALLGHMLFEGEGVPRDAVRGLMFLSIARERADPSQTWIFDMQQQAVAVATETERRNAMALADDWFSKNGVARATN
jgi:TPR repeat protein